MNGQALEVSIVMPCLNEAETLTACIQKAQEAMTEHGIAGEIIVADNGSTDGSVDIARKLGARLVSVAERGYGHALMGGIAAARGRFIIMGDADDSYDFREVPNFVEKLREGFDLVQGCRLPRGGGRILPGAMPFLHRWWGNPILSWLAQHMFGVRVTDVYCGLRGFSKGLYERLDQRCTGMEFATEMIVKASLRGERVSEVPITLHPDGRRSHPPHLNTLRDGWRTLRFYLMYSPRWLFEIPGALLFILGLLGYGVALPGLSIKGVTFDAHTLLFASLAMLLGYQSLLFALFTRTFAMTEGLLPRAPGLERFFRIMNLERTLVVGGTGLVVGAVLLLSAVDIWRSVGFGPLDYARTMRLVVPGTTLTALGFQTVLGGFFVSILGLRRQ